MEPAHSLRGKHHRLRALLERHFFKEGKSDTGLHKSVICHTKKNLKDIFDFVPRNQYWPSLLLWQWQLEFFASRWKSALWWFYWKTFVLQTILSYFSLKLAKVCGKSWIFERDLRENSIHLLTFREMFLKMRNWRFRFRFAMIFRISCVCLRLGLTGPSPKKHGLKYLRLHHVDVGPLTKYSEVSFLQTLCTLRWKFFINSLRIAKAWTWQPGSDLKTSTPTLFTTSGCRLGLARGKVPTPLQ